MRGVVGPLNLAAVLSFKIEIYLIGPQGGPYIVSLLSNTPSGSLGCALGAATTLIRSTYGVLWTCSPCLRSQQPRLPAAGRVSSARRHRLQAAARRAL